MVRGGAFSLMSFQTRQTLRERPSCSPCSQTAGPADTSVRPAPTNAAGAGGSGHTYRGRRPPRRTLTAPAGPETSRAAHFCRRAGTLAARTPHASHLGVLLMGGGHRLSLSAGSVHTWGLSGKDRPGLQSSETTGLPLNPADMTCVMFLTRAEPATVPRPETGPASPPPITSLPSSEPFWVEPPGYCSRSFPALAQMRGLRMHSWDSTSCLLHQ